MLIRADKNKILKKYKLCILCRKVWVKRVFYSLDFLPICIECRQNMPIEFREKLQNEN